MALIIIYAIFIIAFFGNLLVETGLIPPEVTLATEFSTYLLFCFSFFQNAISGRSRLSFHLVSLYAGFAVVALASAILNHRLDISLIIGLRPILRFYILYLALINLPLSERQSKKINILLFAIFILQLPVSFTRFLALGISENTIGTYGNHGGGLTPIIPIVAIGYLAGFYIFWKKKLIYPIIGLGFIAFGILGEKRVLFFLFPVAFMAIYYIGYIKGKKVSPAKFIGAAVLVLTITISVQILMMMNIRTLNPDQKTGGGRIDYGYVLDYAKKYETSEYYGRKGSGGGRASTTLIAMNTVLNNGVGHLFFGFGPGTVVSSIIKTNARIDKRLLPYTNSYGKTGLTYILVEYGLFGALLLGPVYLIFMVKSYQWFKTETDPYWKSLALGNVIFAGLYVFLFFTYNRMPVNDDTMLPVYFYAMAMMYSRLNKQGRSMQKIGEK
ncbi:MAG: hypothetical protein NDI81_14490 [Desulfobacula sp.]|nr:hypothetical protein [Desulfobacula sp.]